jgi:hypothetical protein
VQLVPQPDRGQHLLGQCRRQLHGRVGRPASGWPGRAGSPAGPGGHGVTVR